MAIRKQEFYEGAALHILARSTKIGALRYEAPFFVVNEQVLVHLKYSTRGRSPWGFTFTADEQALLAARASGGRIIVGFVCGADGVAAIDYSSYRSIATIRKSAIHIACHRHHGEYYQLSGPDGVLREKVAPSNWRHILEG